jgi:hypothetical protein
MKMQTSRDPGETLIEWHREQKTRAEVGNDPNAFFHEALRSVSQADPANQAKVSSAFAAASNPNPAHPDRPPRSLPPSLTRATAAATIDADDNDVSDEGLWRHANA